jgi:hypothetical protein
MGAEVPFTSVIVGDYTVHLDARDGDGNTTSCETRSRCSGTGCAWSSPGTPTTPTSTCTWPRIPRAAVVHPDRLLLRQPHARGQRRGHAPRPAGSTWTTPTGAAPRTSGSTCRAPTRSTASPCTTTRRTGSQRHEPRAGGGLLRRAARRGVRAGRSTADLGAGRTISGTSPGCASTAAGRVRCAPLEPGGPAERGRLPGLKGARGRRRANGAPRRATTPAGCHRTPRSGAR